MTTVHDINGSEVDYDAAVNLMDDEIREALHAEMAPCKPQDFFVAYAKAHEDKHGEQFAPYCGTAW